MADPTPKPSCIECPSFLPNGPEVVNAFGRGTGSAMCMRYGYVLGKPGSPPAHEKKLREKFAEGCPSYLDPRPSQPGRDHTVMLPMPEARQNIDPERQAFSTCTQCRNFVGERTVGDELGWTSGLCTAFGKLVPTNRVQIEARNCEYRQFGPSLGMDGMHLLPIYAESFIDPATAAVAAYRDAQRNFVEPSEWPTSREVSEADRAGGIKAWRGIPDPEESGNTAYLPVYDEHFVHPDGTPLFTEEQRALIPRTGDDEHPELYVDHFGGLYTLAVAWLELDETPMLHGQPGTGKTELFRYAAWIMCAPFRRLSITADSQKEDVIGSKEYNPEIGTFFVMGELPTAWTSPGVLVIDEPNVAKDPAVWHEIRPLTDNSKQMVLKDDGNRRLDRHPDCYMGMAINPAWDIRNVGTMEIADADTNRLYHLYVDMPPEEIEKGIIKKRVALDGWELSDKQLKALMGTAEDLRGLAGADGALPVTWAIRQQIKTARALRWFTPATAYRRAIADALDPDQVKMVMDVVNSHWTEES